MKIRSFLCITLALLMLAAIPCAAAESTFSKYKTIPTEHGAVSEFASDVTESPLYQKSIAFFGDSLCYARIERGDSNDEATVRKAGYAGRIATKYDMTLHALGVSGSTFAVTGQTGVIPNKIQFEKDNTPKAEREAVDFVVLEGGVNDISAKAPLGTISEDGKNLNKNTLAGGVEYAIQLAQQTYPNAEIYFLIMYQMPRDKNEFRSDPEIAGQYMDLIIEICEKYKIPYLDFFHDETFNRDVFKINTTEFVGGDGIHMTVKGYDTLTPYIISWLEDPIRRQSGTISKPSTDTSETEPNETEPVDTTDSDDVTNTIGTLDTTDPEGGDEEYELDLGLLIGISAAAVVVIGGVIVAVVIVSKKKKK